MSGQCRADGLIDPDAIPGANIDAAKVETAGTAFSTSATDVETRGGEVKTAWAKLGSSYTTPDSTELLAVMDGVETDTAALAATLQKASTFIGDYATAVAPIAKRLVELKAEAATFVEKALKGKTVGPWDPEHPANQGIVGLVQNFGEVLDDVHLPWDQYTPYVDENNELLTKVAEQETKLSAASAECVNAINGLRTDMCLAPVQAVDYTAAVKANEPMPWGSTGRGDQSCQESFDSGVYDAAKGTVEGLGGLIGYNSQTGEWGDGDWAAQSWKGFAESLGLIVLMGSPPLLIAAALPKGVLPDVVGDTARNIIDQQKTLVEGFVGSPEDWRDDPAHAAGGAAFNIGTLFIPGAGEIGAGAKVAALGSRLAVLGADGSKLALIGSKVAAAGTTIVRVGDALSGLPGKALSGVSDLLARGRGGFADALRGLGDKIPTVKVSVEHAMATPDGFGVGVGRPHIEVGNPGSGGHWLHSVADRVDGGSSSHTGDSASGASVGPAHVGTSAPSRDSWETSYPSERHDPHEVRHVSYIDDALREKNLQPSTRYVMTDRSFVLDTDALGRTVHADSIVSEIVPQGERVRSSSEQLLAGRADRLPGDHGGHVVATAHGGSPFGANLVAQHGGTVNLRAFAKIERDIRRMLKADPDSPIRMETDIVYDAASHRPSQFRITWGKLGEEPEVQIIGNNNFLSF